MQGKQLGLEFTCLKNSSGQILREVYVPALQHYRLLCASEFLWAPTPNLRSLPMAWVTLFLSNLSLSHLSLA